MIVYLCIVVVYKCVRVAHAFWSDKCCCLPNKNRVSVLQFTSKETAETLVADSVSNRVQTVVECQYSCTCRRIVTPFVTRSTQLGTLSATFEITRRSPVSSTSRQKCSFDVHASRGRRDVGATFCRCQTSCLICPLFLATTEINCDLNMDWRRFDLQWRWQAWFHENQRHHSHEKKTTKETNMIWRPHWTDYAWWTSADDT